MVSSAGAIHSGSARKTLQRELIVIVDAKAGLRVSPTGLTASASSFLTGFTQALEHGLQSRRA